MLANREQEQRDRKMLDADQVEHDAEDQARLNMQRVYALASESAGVSPPLEFGALDSRR